MNHKKVAALAAQVNNNVIAIHNEFGQSKIAASSREAGLLLHAIEHGKYNHHLCPHCRVVRVKWWFSKTKKGRYCFRQHLLDHLAVRHQLGAEYEYLWATTALQATKDRLSNSKKLVDWVQVAAKTTARKRNKKNFDELLVKFKM